MVLRSIKRLIPVIPALLLHACASAPADRTKTADSSFEQKWGVRVLGIRPAAAGYMLDFRYRVVDKEKAGPVLNRKTRPYLVVEKDNSKLHVPVAFKLGALRQTTQHVKANRNYFMFFANPGKRVKSGDVVRVVIGDYQTERLKVN